MDRWAVVEGCLRCVWILVVLLGGAGCGPARAPQATIESPLTAWPFARANEWTFLELDRRPSIVESQLAQGVQRKLPEVARSEEYMCVAREAASYMAEHFALPDELLQRWIVGRCGASNVFYFSSWVRFDADGILDGPLHPEALQNALAMLTEQVPRSGVFGVGAHSSGSVAFMVLAITKLDTVLQVRGPDADGMVRIDGRMAIPAEGVRGLINQGQTGSADCEREPNVKLPEFALTCPMAEEDDEAWIDVVAHPEGEFLELPVGNVLALRPEARRLPYRRPFVKLPESNNTTRALFQGINILRRRTGLPVLRFEAAQSGLARSFYAQVFEAEVNIDVDAESKFRHALLAGHEVQGIIRSARICLGVAYRGTAGDWLAARLAQPVSREVLMNPDAESVAIATHHDAEIGFGAGVVAYSLFHEHQHEIVAEAMYEDLDARRSDLSHTTSWMEEPPELLAAAEAVMAGESSPEEALQTALEAINARSDRPIAGLTFSGPWAAGHLDLPEELFEPRSLECAIVVTHTKRAGATWGEFVVFVVYVAPGAKPKGA